ncbi:hypothetical protein ACWEOV_36285 [Streptomyces sp. NPDC004365]
MRQDEILSLLGEFTYHRLETLVSAGHLAVVFNPVGQLFYGTPSASSSCRRAGSTTGRSPSRPSTAPASNASAPLRPCPSRELCELHGIALWQCMLPGPREQFECQ